MTPVFSILVCIASAEKFSAKAQALSKQRRRKLSALRRGRPAGPSGASTLHPQLRRPLHHFPLKKEPAQAENKRPRGFTEKHVV